MKKYFIALGISTSFLLILILPYFNVFAEVTGDSGDPLQTGFEIVRQFGGGSLGEAELTTVIVKLVNVLLGFLGIIAVIIILWGGFKWMTAAGNEENVREARNVIVAGIIGLGIIIASYSIAWFAVRAFSYATSDGASSFG